MLLDLATSMRSVVCTIEVGGPRCYVMASGGSFPLVVARRSPQRERRDETPIRRDKTTPGQNSTTKDPFFQLQRPCPAKAQLGNVRLPSRHVL